MSPTKYELPQGYQFLELPHEEFQKLWKEWGDKIFKQNDTSLDFQKILTDF